MRQGTWSVELLEQRCVLSALVAGVGVVEDLDDSFNSVMRGAAMEGVLSDSNVFTGTGFIASTGEPEAISDDPDQLTFNSDGSFSFEPSEDPFDDWGHQYTASFRSASGMQVGWLFGHDTGVNSDLTVPDGAGFEVSYYVERPSSASVSDFQGQWFISLHQWTPGVSAIGDSYVGTFSVSGTSFGLSAGPLVLSGTAEVLDSHGKVRLVIPGPESAQTWAYLNSTKTAMIGVSLSESLTSGVIFVAMRPKYTVDAAIVPGQYRVEMGLDAAMTASVLGRSNVAETGVLNLLAGGTGTYAPLDGGQVRAATWYVAAEQVHVSTVIRGTDVDLSYYVSPDGGLLMLRDLFPHNGGSQVLGAMGLGVRSGSAVAVEPAFDVAAAHGVIENGEAVLYMANRDEDWYRVALMRTYFPAFEGYATGVDVQLDLATGELRVAVLAHGFITVLFFDEQTGEFVSGNLASMVDGDDEPIMDGLFAFQDSVNVSASDLYFGGRTFAGDIVVYRLDGQTRAWGRENLGERLRERGMEMPRTTGELTPFVTAWGAMNIVGLNDQGDIEAVWWHSTTNGWTTNNLSEITGAPAYSGRLTVFLTSWSAINIAGTTQDGSLVATWWVPEFGGNWAASNFTDLFGGPLFAPESVAAYVTSWGQMTVLGIAGGEVVAYWWAPGFDAWLIANISEISLSGNLLHGRLTTQFTGRDEINIYGRSMGEQDVRFSWDPASVWDEENLSLVAQAR
ncbi:MAG: hypothetical protein GIKADHBN_02228 [Phycisphaerales bacterium]|nr:hypothetical protein [Phycisphaerales bacterium]